MYLDNLAILINKLKYYLILKFINFIFLNNTILKI